MGRRAQGLNFEIGILTPSMAADMCGVSRRTIHKWIDACILPCGRVEGSRDVFINPHHVKALLEKSNLPRPALLLQCCKNHDNRYGVNEEENKNEFEGRISEHGFNIIDGLSKRKFRF